MGLIALPGKNAPPIRTLEGETEMHRLQAGARDVGFLSWILGHRQELIVSSHRIIKFSRKTRDYTVEILPRRKIDLFTGGSNLNVTSIIAGIVMILLGVGALVNGVDGSAVVGIILFVFGLIQLLLARTRTFAFGAAGGAIAFSLHKATPEQTEAIIDYISSGLD